jgi:hypothetical protein
MSLHYNFHSFFRNRNVLFIGDPIMRSMYCDLSRVLHKDKMLHIAEIGRYHKNHTIYISVSVHI